MAIYYSAHKRGFFHDQVHDTIPEGSVEITDEEWRYLLDQQTDGYVIVPGDDGKPTAVGPTVQERATRVRTARNRALSETDSLVSRHRDETETAGSTTLTREQYIQLQGWRQMLRAAPSLPGFPDIELPPKPVWLETKR